VTAETTGIQTQYYTYSATGELVGIRWDGDSYYYIKNAQGDIIQIVDDDGSVVVAYTYDTWGKLVSITGSAATTLGVANPYRYRSYRYDNETGFYYLNSRYYGPETGRFINADAINGFYGDLNTGNMFAYCNNNPASMHDIDGLYAGYIESKYGVGLGLGRSQTIALVWDDKGNLYIVKSYTELLDPYEYVFGASGGVSLLIGYSGLDTAEEFICKNKYNRSFTASFIGGLVIKSNYSKASSDPIGHAIGGSLGFGVTFTESESRVTKVWKLRGASSSSRSATGYGNSYFSMY